MFRMLKNNRGSWGVVAGAAASVVAGAASSAINKGTAEDGQMGYDMPMMTPSPYDAENQRLSSQLAQGMALNSMQGRLAPGVELLLNRMKQQQLLESKEAMYGTAGRRGGSTMDNTMAMGAMGGVGPKAMMAQGSRAMNDYAGRNAQIQNYIDSLKYAGLQNQQQQAITAMQSMPRSSEIPYQGQTVSMNQAPQSGMDTGLQNVDWMKAMSGLMGGGNTPTEAGRINPQQTFVYGNNAAPGFNTRQYANTGLPGQTFTR